MPLNGFYTEEEAEDGRRKGFIMKTLDGRTAYLAHEDILSDCRIRRFGVSIENIDSIAAASIVPAEGRIIILDEIGKMECFSGRFRLAAVTALDSRNIVVGTITLGGGDFIKRIKEREDVVLIKVTEADRDSLDSLVISKIKRMAGSADYRNTGGKYNEH